MWNCGVLGARDDYKAALEECRELKARVEQLQEQLEASRIADREVENELKQEMQRQQCSMDYRSVF